MELIPVIITSIASIVVLFILTKLMGYREVSQLSMFDYINSITIGSIAAEMATANGGDFIKPLIAMVVYTLIVIVLALITNKSFVLRKFISGTPAIIFHNDELYYKNLKKNRIDICEFLVSCRNSGYFDLSQLQTAILEPNGKISYLPKSSYRPVNPHDMNLTPNADYPVANVIIEGKIQYNILKHSGKDEKWLLQQLHAQGTKDIKDIFLATCDIDNNVHVYKKNKPLVNINIFE